MSDYSKLTNFASKDSLASGNPLKVIKGTEIDDEFEAIETAVATKADTADLTALKEAIYPVGSIYTNATNNTNPATLLGFGTWSLFGSGRMLVGYDSTDTLFDAAEETGGSKDAIVVEHTHTATVTDPGHSHYYYGPNASSEPSFTPQDYKSLYDESNITTTSTTGITVANSTEGSSGTNANLPPYITVYMWKRTA